MTRRLNPGIYSTLAQLHRQGRNLMSSGDFNQAEQMAAAMLKLHGEDLEGLGLMLDSLLAQGRVQDALPAAERLTMLTPQDYSAHYKLGKLLFELEDVPGAAIHFEAALELEPPDHLQRELGQVIELLDRLQARQILTLASEDTLFRMELRDDLEATLDDHGFHLSEDGLRRLAQFDLSQLGTTRAKRGLLPN